MATGYIIALAIVIIAIIGFIIGLVIILKDITETIDYINDFSEEANHVVQHYQPDIKEIDDKVQLLTAKAEGVTETLNYKMTSFDLLQQEGSELAHHLQVLNQNKEVIAQNAFDQVKEKVQTEGPGKWDNFKEVTKRTIQKQKARYQDQ